MKTLRIELTETRSIIIEIAVNESEYKELRYCARNKAIVINAQNPVHNLILNETENAEIAGDSEFCIDDIEVIEADDYGVYEE